MLNRHSHDCPHHKPCNHGRQWPSLLLMLALAMSGGAGCFSSPQVESADSLDEQSSALDQRPTWVDAPPRREGDVYRRALTVGPYQTRAECDAALPEALQRAAQVYVAALLGDKSQVVLPLEHLNSHVVQEFWEEPIVSPTVGPMVQLHARLAFDGTTRRLAQEAQRQQRVSRRLGVTWAVVGLLLVGIGTGYVYLRRGTGRGA